MTNKRGALFGVAASAAAVGFAFGAYFAVGLGRAPKLDLGAATSIANAKEADPSDAAKSGQATGAAADSVELSDTQLTSLKVETVATHAFPIEKVAVGSIDFNEEMSVQVFTPYQGRIIDLYAKVGEEVAKGTTLFTIESPDLIQAESTLIAAAGVLDLTTRTLNRLKMLFETRAIAQKDLEQATSDQQTAEGALKAARDAVRIFGKSDTEIDRIIADRRVDGTLIVNSPISGLITARNAAPGLLVQPGNPPAPYSVADTSTMWMLANVAESDSPSFHRGQEVKVSVMAYPGRVFEGRISTIGATVDPNTHRVLLRSEIKDPNFELRPGMFANFVIRTGDPVSALAVPFDGVVREGDGTMTVWVATDTHHFTKRTVKIGMQRDGYDQIVEGLVPGEMIVTEGALFVSNALASASE
jgi:cobalt-zinc-cadmium efflux system membrane fusion protein